MLVIFSSPPFYSNHIRLPQVNDPVLNFILNNSKFFPFFWDALEATNSLYFNTHTAASNYDALHDHNGTLTTNSLAICDFTMWFLHIQSGWEGSIYLMENISLQMRGFQPVPFYLFYIIEHNTILLNGTMHSYNMDTTFTLYCYSLSEFCSPTTSEELFNSQHASTQTSLRGCQSDQTTLQNINHSARIFHGHTSIGISHTCSNS